MSIIGKTVTVTVDRKMGTYHPEHADIYYPINYGYVKDIYAFDGEEQDAYIIGISTPVQKFTGIVIAVIHRLDDIEDKWVVAPFGKHYTAEQIMAQVNFQEQYFKTEIEI
ncbi:MULTISPECIES: inorganic pyrophosphatase [unclassified Ruminococcus]|uniref:inorganic pyrophosphatase n=1 Tax=unclassified Ruminococcus TaxID=2608920 RepID=UPI0021093878|nr:MULTISPECIES: inorganic pyrophosphatase [unclassified Ruminococcus]MCQ4022250.1 inorganic pyrophosphatase [Ruminococcus sp. zg-924]MCQ4114578.1 inorganic pyrophosphatase [Ruminococcus sp. zg-921]